MKKYEIGEIFIPHKKFFGCVVPNWLLKQKNIGPIAKLCYGRLAQFSGNDGRCYPKQGTLSEEIGVTRTSVVFALKELEELKLITRQKPKGRDILLHKPDSYSFIVHELFIDELNKHSEDLTCEPECKENEHPDVKNTKKTPPIRGKYNETSDVQNKNTLINKNHDLIESNNKLSSPYGEDERFDNRSNSPIEKHSYKKQRTKILLDNKEPVIREFIKTDIKEQSAKSVIRKTVKPLPVTQAVQDVFDYWLEVGLKMPAVGTKRFNDCVKKVKALLKGNLLNQKYSMEEIRKSIHNYSLAALDKEFEPRDPLTKRELSSKTIGDFIYNPFYSNGNASQFKRFLNPPKTIKEKDLLPNPTPIVVSNLKKFYTREILGGVNVKLTDTEENTFRLAAKKLQEFYNNNIKKINQFVRVDQEVLSEWLIDAIRSDCGDNLQMITPAWFASDTTFNRRLPAYLYSQAIILGGGYDAGASIHKTFSLYDDY